MSSKTISLRDETYHRLHSAKGPDESFSDVIDRLLGAEGADHPLKALVGLLDEDEAERLRSRSRAFRADIEERINSGER